MKRNIKVRGRDGAIRLVNDDYIVRDGEALVVEHMFMDAQSRPTIHDGHGNPAGQRPGFLYSDGNEQAERALAAAYAEYDEALSNRWRHGPGQRPSQTRSAPQTFDNPEAARAAAYAEYDRDISERWRK